MATGNNNQRDNRTAKPAEKPRSAARKTLRFLFNPEFGRSASNIGNTFHMFVQMLALLFASNGTLEKDHPFLKQGTRFTMGDLFRETHERIEWNNKEKIPQTVFFCAVWGLLTGAILYLITFVLLFVAAPSQAHAQTPSAPPAQGGSLFKVEDEKSDMGLRLIDHLILGKDLPIFSGNVDQLGNDQADGLNAGMIQSALRSMLTMYSSAILVLASFLLLYHIVMLVVNSAWSGKPLEGANAIWGPLRLVIAIGLLVPLSSGLNSGQHIGLKVAQVGSSLASNIWGGFVSGLQVADAKIPEMPRADVAQQFYDMIMINICKYDINDKIGGLGKASAAAGDTLVQNGGLIVLPTVTNVAIFMGRDRVLSNLSNIDGNNNTCNIGPMFNKDLCGTIKLPRPYGVSSGCFEGKVVCDPSGGSLATCSGGISGNAANDEEANRAVGARNTDEGRMTFAIREQAMRPAIKLYQASDAIARQVVEWYKRYEVGEEPKEDIGSSKIAEDAGKALRTYYTEMNNVYKSTIPTEVANYRKKLSDRLQNNNQGWIMAGSHFMRIAAVQRAVAAAMDAAPSAERGELFGRVSNTGKSSEDKQDTKNASKNSIHDRFLDQIANDTGYAKSVKALIQCGMGADSCEGGGAKIDVQEIPDEYKTAVSNIQPVLPAQADKDNLAPRGILAKLNNFLTVDKNMFVRLVTPNITDPFSALFNVGHYLYTIGLLLMIPGFLVPGGAMLFTLGAWAFTSAIFLVFILPLIPMVKFLTATLGWLFAVFESMVGIPLFALAHLTPGGQGLLDPVRHGYTMLLNIALQPIFLIFGLVGAILMTTIGLYALNLMYMSGINAVWGDGDVLVTTAVGFMAVYCLNAYAICNISFRLIDDIGQKSMQWFGGQGYGFRDVDQGATSEASKLLIANLSQKAIGGAGTVAGLVRKNTGERFLRKKGDPNQGVINAINGLRNDGGLPAPNSSGNGEGGPDGSGGSNGDPSGNGPGGPGSSPSGGGQGFGSNRNLLGQGFTGAGGNLPQARGPAGAPKFDLPSEFKPRDPITEGLGSAQKPALGGGNPLKPSGNPNMFDLGSQGLTKPAPPTPPNNLASRIAKVSPGAGSALRAAQLGAGELGKKAQAGLQPIASALGAAGAATAGGAAGAAAAAGGFAGGVAGGIAAGVGSRIAKIDRGIFGNKDVRQKNASLRQQMAGATSSEQYKGLQSQIKPSGNMIDRAVGGSQLASHLAQANEKADASITPSAPYTDRDAAERNTSPQGMSSAVDNAAATPSSGIAAGQGLGDTGDAASTSEPTGGQGFGDAGGAATVDVSAPSVEVPSADVSNVSFSQPVDNATNNVGSDFSPVDSGGYETANVQSGYGTVETTAQVVDTPAPTMSVSDVPLAAPSSSFAEAQPPRITIPAPPTDNPQPFGQSPVDMPPSAGVQSAGDAPMLRATMQSQPSAAEPNQFGQASYTVQPNSGLGASAPSSVTASPAAAPQAPSAAVTPPAAAETPSEPPPVETTRAPFKGWSDSRPSRSATVPSAPTAAPAQPDAPQTYTPITVPKTKDLNFSTNPQADAQRLVEQNVRQQQEMLELMQQQQQAQAEVKRTLDRSRFYEALKKSRENGPTISRGPTRTR